MKIKKIALFSALILLICFTFYAEKQDKNLERAINSIRPMDAYGYCKILSSPEFAGRHTGHKGYTKAARWAAQIFREWGLKPISKEEGYLQAYSSPYTLIDNAEMSLFLPEIKEKEKKGTSFKKVNLELEKDFLPLLYSDKGNQTSELVFAGWGICAPELGYDDYSGLDVEGKFILCFRGIPDKEDNRFQKYNYHRLRMKTAKERRALGLIYINPDPIANPNGDMIKGFTPAIVSEKVADMILKEKGLKSSNLKRDLIAYKKPLSFPLQTKLSYKVESRHFADGKGYNIVGYVDGSDAHRKKECLVIGGHFDHCGLHMGLLFAGANDNASGSAVVMEIAEAFTKLQKKPKRSIVFVLFGGEEMGLMGSKYFANHIPPRFDKVDAMFNFDMVGEGDGTVCLHSPTPSLLKNLIEKANSYVQILKQTRSIQGVGVRGSDHAPFFAKGIPVAAFFSNGPHLYYHQTGDTIFRINPDIMASIARLAFLSAFEWADR